jgi:phosphatidylglycerophosphatase A
MREATTPSPPAGRPARPTLRFMFSHPAHLVSLGFGSGLSPFAPGTFGTLVAIPIAHALWAWSNDVVFLAVTIALLFAGAWAADRTGAALGVADDGAIVVDEIVAFLLVLFFVGPDAGRIAFAFVLFRLFDIVKPPPIRAIDARMKTGLGVMVDDIVAAGFALVVYALVVRLTGWPP